MPKDVDFNTTLEEILSNKETTIYGKIKRVRFYVYFHPYDISGKKTLADLLSRTGYGMDESKKIYEQIEEEEGTRELDSSR